MTLAGLASVWDGFTRPGVPLDRVGSDLRLSGAYWSSVRRKDAREEVRGERDQSLPPH